MSDPATPNNPRLNVRRFVFAGIFLANGHFKTEVRVIKTSPFDLVKVVNDQKYPQISQITQTQQNKRHNETVMLF